MKYKVGDLIVPTRLTGAIYEILSVNDYEYQVKVVDRTNSRFHNTGTVFWHPMDDVEQKSRPATKLEKTLL